MLPFIRSKAPHSLSGHIQRNASMKLSPSLNISSGNCGELHKNSARESEVFQKLREGEGAEYRLWYYCLSRRYS